MGRDEKHDKEHEVTAEAARVYELARGLVADRDVIAREGSAPGFHSSPPWNAAAANVVTGIHSAARRAEARLAEAAGLPVRGRGGSDGNTSKALERVADLAAAAPAGAAEDELAELGRLADEGGALPAIDETDRWEPLPREPGQAPVCCPYCRTPSLRFIRGKLLVACCRPRCKDGDGNRPAARVDRAPRSATPALLWNDGLVT